MRHVLPLLIVVTLTGACTPLRDLDATASGNAERGSGGTSVSDETKQTNQAGTAAGGTTPADNRTAPSVGGTITTSVSSGTGGTITTSARGGTGGAITTSARGGTGGAITTSARGGTGGTITTSARGGTGGTITTSARGGTGGTTLAGASSIAPDLPDLPNSPVQGTITYSVGASWDIDGVQVPAFEIHTPSANYWFVKSAGAIVEITDSSGLKWISFSSGYRPNRGVPNLGGCCQPGDPAKLGMPEMRTELDAQSVTLTHLRLVSKPVDGDYYWLVWDFYLTHVTVTINRSEKPFGFTYHGVPGGNLDLADELGLSTGVTRNASYAFAEDLPGPIEWAYLTDPESEGTLLLVQHTDDALPESYLVADGNSSKFTFGGGTLTKTPVRYSLGLVNSISHAEVSERVAFVVNATPR